MTNEETDRSISVKTYAQKKCLLCGEDGELIYKDLKDNLFNVPGKWTVRKCKNLDCGLMWLGEMPVLGDIPKLYKKYYTHRNLERESLFFKIYEKTLKGYLSVRYGYNCASLVEKLLGYLVYIEPGIKALADSKVFELPYLKEGKLLEVGCGDGRNLKYLEGLGWNVEGLDFDGQAINNASAKGLNVSTSDLISKEYPSNYFDAVVNKHVIEHIPNPIEFLKEVYRILKPKGMLVMYTPNTDSIGLRIFKNNWRGLEPPRHLYIYNINSLSQMVHKVGYANINCEPTYSGAPILLSSYSLYKHNKINAKISVGKMLKLIILHYTEWLIVMFDKKSGEEIVLKAIKGEFKSEVQQHYNEGVAVS